MNVHRNGLSEVVTGADEAKLGAALAVASSGVLAEARRARQLELRDEAADLIDSAAGIDTTLPIEHRTRELVMLQGAFADLLERRGGRPLTAPEQATLDGLRAVFEGAKTIRAAEAAARAEVASAVDLAAVRAVRGVGARRP